MKLVGENKTENSGLGDKYICCCIYWPLSERYLLKVFFRGNTSYSLMLLYAEVLHLLYLILCLIFIFKFHFSSDAGTSNVSRLADSEKKRKKKNICVHFQMI